jgi:hypothetical protein
MSRVCFCYLRLCVQKRKERGVLIDRLLNDERYASDRESLLQEVAHWAAGTTSELESHQLAASAGQLPVVNKAAVRAALIILQHKDMSFLHSDDDEVPVESPAVSSTHAARSSSHKVPPATDTHLARYGQNPPLTDPNDLPSRPARSNLNGSTSHHRIMGFDVHGVGVAPRPVSVLGMPVYYECPHRTLAGEMLVRTLDTHFAKVHPNALGIKRNLWAFHKATGTRETNERDTFKATQEHQLRTQGKKYAAGLMFLLKNSERYVPVAPQASVA